MFEKEVATVVIGLVGYAGGTGINSRFRNRIERTRKDALMAPKNEQGTNKSKIPKLAKFVTGLGLVGGVFGMSATQALWPNNSKNIKPEISVAAQFDYSTALDNSAKSEVQAVTQVDRSPKNNYHISAAVNGHSKTIYTNNQLSNLVPFGSVSIGSTVLENLNNGFNNASNIVSNSLRNVPNSKSGVELIFTDNGTDLGDSQLLISAANSAGNIPIDIVNVSGSATPPASNPEYQAITSGTSGNYWSLDTTNAAQVIPQINSSITKENVPNPDNNQNYFWDATAVLSGLAFIRMTQLRSQESFIA